MNAADIPEVVQAELKNIANIVDGLGMPIDDGIALLVAALRCHGFYTTASCYGHLNRKTTGPYVCIEDLESDKMLRNGPREGQPFLDNRKKVRRMNYLQRLKLYELITEFYATHQYVFSAGIMIEDQGPGLTRLHNQMHEVIVMPEMSAEYPQWLENAQAEMNAFAAFLCKKLA